MEIDTTEYELEGETWTEEEKEGITQWRKFWDEQWMSFDEQDNGDTPA